MVHFLIRRTILGVIALFVVISLTFVMMRIMPGSPFTKERNLPPAIEKNLLARYKMDGTLWEQYSAYILDVARLHLRPSLRYRNRSVNEILAQTLPVSIALGSAAFLISLGAGITLGSIAAVRHRTWADHSSMVLAVLSISIPNFVIAPLAILCFALTWPIFPVAGWGTLSHLVLPAVSLALPYATYIARLTRNSMLDVVHQDFMRTARAKGLDEAHVIIKHALKVALLPVVSFSGPLAAHMLTGSLVIEEIFKVPGVGAFFVNGVLNRDHHMVGGAVIVYSTLLIAFNMVVDVIYTFLDRRIKLA